MAWVLLIGAGLLEVVWSSALKQSHGLSRPVPTVIFAIASIASLAGLALAMRSLPLGTSYAVWTGIGAVGTFAVGIMVLGEPATASRLLAAGLIVAGLILLKIVTPGSEASPPG